MGGKHIKTEKRNIRFRLKKVSEAKKRGERGKKQRRQSPWNRHNVGLNDEKCVTGIYNMKTLFGSFELLKESVQAIASMWLVKRNLWVSLFALHPPHQLIWSVHLYLLLLFFSSHTPIKSMFNKTDQIHLVYSLVVSWNKCSEVCTSPPGLPRG